MTRVTDLFARIPRFAWFAAAALIQVALVALMVVDRIQTLRQGTEVMLQTRPVDPRDFLRGDYVVLGYDISSVPTAGLARDSLQGKTVFVKLAPRADGFHEAASAHLEPVAVTRGEVLIRGRVFSTCMPSAPPSARGLICDRLGVTYGIEKYFVPEGEGRDIESARNQGKVAIVAAVTPAGKAAIKRLLIDGKPVYDEPLF